MLQKSDMMYQSKEATTKDRSLKTQLVLATRDGNNCYRENLEKKQGFFGGQTTYFTINKANFPKNTLVYAN